MESLRLQFIGIRGPQVPKMLSICWSFMIVRDWLLKGEAWLMAWDMIGGLGNGRD